MRQRLKAVLRKNELKDIGQLDRERVPRHIAIIMDGNGRWARRRGLPRTAGHHAGMEALKRTVRAACELGVKVLTVYAFSTENWQRPQVEVEFLMRLPNQYLMNELAEIQANHIRVMVTGSLEGLPPYTQEAVKTALAETERNHGMVLNFALNYGSRAELVHAVRQIAVLVREGVLDEKAIDEETVARHLYTAGLPDPDLLIRPSGEIRLSNFLLWQLAYTELWFSDVYWPDFDRKHLVEAILVYQKRDRRYGGIKP